MEVTKFSASFFHQEYRSSFASWHLQWKVFQSGIKNGLCLRLSWVSTLCIKRQIRCCPLWKWCLTGAVQQQIIHVYGILVILVSFTVSSSFKISHMEEEMEVNWLVGWVVALLIQLQPLPYETAPDSSVTLISESLSSGMVLTDNRVADAEIGTVWPNLASCIAQSQDHSARSVQCHYHH